MPFFRTSTPDTSNGSGVDASSSGAILVGTVVGTSVGTEVGTIVGVVLGRGVGSGTFLHPGAADSVHLPVDKQNAWVRKFAASLNANPNPQLYVANEPTYAPCADNFTAPFLSASGGGPHPATHTVGVPSQVVFALRSFNCCMPSFSFLQGTSQSLIKICVASFGAGVGLGSSSKVYLVTGGIELAVEDMQFFAGGVFEDKQLCCCVKVNLAGNFLSVMQVTSSL